VGDVGGGEDDSTVVGNCYATGTVTGDLEVGGLVGVAASSTVENCYATGTVMGTSIEANNYIGKLIGNRGSSDVRNCYYPAAGQLPGGGGAPLHPGAAQRDFNGFDFTTIWGWEDGRWPYLRSFLQSIQTTRPGL